jgi:hypothetical protein
LYEQVLTYFHTSPVYESCEAFLIDVAPAIYIVDEYLIIFFVNPIDDPYAIGPHSKVTFPFTFQFFDF